MRSELTADYAIGYWSAPVIVAVLVGWWLWHKWRNARWDSAWRRELDAMPAHRRKISEQGFESMTPGEIRDALDADHAAMTRGEIETAEHRRLIERLLRSNLATDRELDDIPKDWPEHAALLARHSSIVQICHSAYRRIEQSGDS